MTDALNTKKYGGRVQGSCLDVTSPEQSGATETALTLNTLHAVFVLD